MLRITANIAIVASLLAFVGGQTCQECQADNAVYCHNQTSYQNCMKNAAFGDIVNCPADTVCSNSGDVCVPSSQVDGTAVLDVCGASGGNGVDCEVCATNAKFSCVSTTQFARCSSSGDLISSTVYSCDADEVCIIDSLSLFGTLCVPTCAADYVGMEATCTNSVYQPVTTTAAPTTTPSADQRQQACRDAEPSSSPNYFYTRNYDDSTCNSYLYCQKSGTDNWVSIYMSCAASRPFFDVSTGSCVVTRPASCSDTTTSTSTVTPTGGPTDAPTSGTSDPTGGPTDAPTSATDAPTGGSTDAPTSAPTSGTNAPTDGPTDAPTSATNAPTGAPTDAPTDAPTNAPTDAPTDAPTNASTDAPTDAPTNVPTDTPTDTPTDAPTTAS
ncbi:hypothetical protein KR038_001049 [Drosophila bunnanda]|nr:hypothetical protein KR038_001049 [Drosophila bunnanda]